MGMGTKPAPIMQQQLQATVTLPQPLADMASRIASEQHWSFSEAVLFLVKRGAKAQEEAERAVAESHERLTRAETPEQEKKASDDLVRAIFGPGSVA